LDFFRFPGDTKTSVQECGLCGRVFTEGAAHGYAVDDIVDIDVPYECGSVCDECMRADDEGKRARMRQHIMMLREKANLLERAVGEEIVAPSVEDWNMVSQD
jgi:hypothetical protein